MIRYHYFKVHAGIDGAPVSMDHLMTKEPIDPNGIPLFQSLPSPTEEEAAKAAYANHRPYTRRASQNPPAAEGPESATN